MLNKISIRVRVTIITVILLTACCIGLTLVLNKTALTMADSINMPAKKIEIISPLLKNSINTSINYDTYTDEENMIFASSNEIAKTTYETFSLRYMLLFILIGGALTYIVMGKTLKPIKELSKNIKNKSVENLSNDLPLGNKKDEIYELTESFNKMARKLNEAFLMQKRFSNSAAHELRTPLTVIRTKLDVFKKRKNPSVEEYDNLIESMRNQLIRLSDIVNSLLSLTNMEDMDLSQNINLKSLIKSVCNDLYSISENKNIEVTVSGEDLTIKGNYDLIYRAFYNLVENSIKYNNENGKVNISIEKEGSNVKVVIKDSGIGISDEMKEKVFEAFFTVDKSRSRKLGGAGIGLSIVKTIIDNHNGSITIKDNKDRGSIFIVQF